MPITETFQKGVDFGTLKKIRHVFCPPGTGFIFGIETFIWGLVEAFHEFGGLFDGVSTVIIYISILIISYLFIILINSYLLYKKYIKSLENNSGLTRQVSKDEKEIKRLTHQLKRNQRLAQIALDNVKPDVQQNILGKLLIHNYIYGDDYNEEKRIQDSKNH